MLNTRRGFRTAAQGETVGDNRAAVRIHKRGVYLTLVFSATPFVAV